MKYALYVGLGLLAHSVFLALQMQSELQAHHHGASANQRIPLPILFPATGAPDSTTTTERVVGNADVGAPVPWYIVLELLIGFLLAALGYISARRFYPIRLKDHQESMRYEHVMCTGPDFVQFHSGRMMATAAAAAAGKKGSAIKSKTA